MNGSPTMIKKDSTANTQTVTEDYNTVMYQDTVSESGSEYSTVQTTGDSVSVANGLNSMFNSQRGSSQSDLWSIPGSLSKAHSVSRKRQLSVRSMGTCEMGVQTDSPLDLYVIYTYVLSFMELIHYQIAFY